MQQRVEILKMLYRDNDILIFDEPTAVLIPQEIEELMKIIRGLTKEGKSVLFISHKLRVYSSNSRCDRQRGIFALRKTFFCRNTDVFQGKMTRRTAKRPAVRVRWELEEYTLGSQGSICWKDGREYRQSAVPAKAAAIAVSNPAPRRPFHGERRYHGCPYQKWSIICYTLS